MTFFAIQYNSSLSSFVPNFRILTQVFAEKSWTEKKFTNRKTDRHTHISTKKAKTIYPLYTWYLGYNDRKHYLQYKTSMYYISALLRSTCLYIAIRHSICLPSSYFYILLFCQKRCIHIAFIKISIFSYN